MPIRFESFIKEGDKNEKNIAKDIVATCSSKRKLSFKSKNTEYIIFEHPLKDENTGKEFGLITNLLKVEEDKLKVRDCNLTINAEPKKIHLYKHLPASDETYDYYLAQENSLFRTSPFVIESVNRHAMWDEKLEGKDVYVGLSAFAFQITAFDNFDEFNKHLVSSTTNSEGNPNPEFDLDFATPIDEESEDPYTVFLGEVLDIQDVKVKLTKHEIEFSIITVDCFLGPLKVVAGRDVFDFSRIEKGKILVIAASIKANFGVDPTPEAIVGNKAPETEKHQDNEITDNAITKLADMGFDISSELKNKAKKAVKKITSIRRQ